MADNVNTGTPVQQAPAPVQQAPRPPVQAQVPAPAASPVAQTPSQAPSPTTKPQTVQAPVRRAIVSPPPQSAQLDANGDLIVEVAAPREEQLLPASTRAEMEAGKAAVDQHLKR